MSSLVDGDRAKPGGRLFGIGVGPGDPELMTLKAVRRLAEADLIVSFSAIGRESIARGIAARFIGVAQAELRLIYPLTTEPAPVERTYDALLAAFYDDAAGQLAAELVGGRDVAVLCEGDPFFYGSFMYLHERLSARFETEIVPGIASLLAAAAVAGTPLVFRNETLSVLSGVLPEAELEARLAQADAAVILKLGRNFAKVAAVLARLDLVDRATYVERATGAGQRVLKLAAVDPANVPYFSLILIPGRAPSTLAARSCILAEPA